MSCYSKRLPSALREAMLVYPDDWLECAASGIVFADDTYRPQGVVRMLATHGFTRLMMYFIANKNVNMLPPAVMMLFLDRGKKKLSIRLASANKFYVDYSTWDHAIYDGTIDGLDVLYATGTFPEDPEFDVNMLPPERDEVVVWFREHFPYVFRKK